jgi:hypothetical protein
LKPLTHRAIATSTAAALAPYVGCISGCAPNFAHARALMRKHGMVQFAKGERVHLEHGYCLDDNARAFLAAILGLHLEPGLEDAAFVAEASLGFCERCRRADGRFHNLMDEQGAFTDEVGSQESLARTLWACGVGARSAPLQSWRDRSRTLFIQGLERIGDLTEPRPKAYAILGLTAALAPNRASPVPPLESLPDPLLAEVKRCLVTLCAQLKEMYEGNAQPGWEWWEPTLTWGNARLPEAMLRGAAALSDGSLEHTGMRALHFLASITQPQDTFVPVGNAGWHERGGERAMHDQQPIEACGMVDAWLAAAKLTGRAEYVGKALEVFGWFFGANTERIIMVKDGGGCCDGLGPGNSNVNMGAESTLSYLQAHAALALALRSLRA